VQVAAAEPGRSELAEVVEEPAGVASHLFGLGERVQVDAMFRHYRLPDGGLGPGAVRGLGVDEAHRGKGVGLRGLLLGLLAVAGHDEDRAAGVAESPTLPA
jgi:GNAT superfamily N-acetyltransferase